MEEGCYFPLNWVDKCGLAILWQAFIRQMWLHILNSEDPREMVFAIDDQAVKLVNLGIEIWCFYMVHEDDRYDTANATLMNISYDLNYFYVDPITARCLKSGLVEQGWPENMANFMHPNEESIADEDIIVYYGHEDLVEEITISDKNVVYMNSSSSIAPSSGYSSQARWNSPPPPYSPPPAYSSLSSEYNTHELASEVTIQSSVYASSIYAPSTSAYSESPQSPSPPPPSPPSLTVDPSIYAPSTSVLLESPQLPSPQPSPSLTVEPSTSSNSLSPRPLSPIISTTGLNNSDAIFNYSPL